MPGSLKSCWTCLVTKFGSPEHSVTRAGWEPCHGVAFHSDSGANLTLALPPDDSVPSKNTPGPTRSQTYLASGRPQVHGATGCSMNHEVSSHSEQQGALSMSSWGDIFATEHYSQDAAAFVQQRLGSITLGRPVCCENGDEATHWSPEPTPLDTVRASNAGVLDALIGPDLSPSAQHLLRQDSGQFPAWPRYSAHQHHLSPLVAVLAQGGLAQPALQGYHLLLAALTANHATYTGCMPDIRNGSSHHDQHTAHMSSCCSHQSAPLAPRLQRPWAPGKAAQSAASVMSVCSVEGVLLPELPSPCMDTGAGCAAGNQSHTMDGCSSHDTGEMRCVWSAAANASEEVACGLACIESCLPDAYGRSNGQLVDQAPLVVSSMAEDLLDI